MVVPLDFHWPAPPNPYCPDTEPAVHLDFAFRMSIAKAASKPRFCFQDISIHLFLVLQRTSRAAARGAERGSYIYAQIPPVRLTMIFEPF